MELVNKQKRLTVIDIPIFLNLLAVLTITGHFNDALWVTRCIFISFISGHIMYVIV